MVIQVPQQDEASTDGLGEKEQYPNFASGNWILCSSCLQEQGQSVIVLERSRAGSPNCTVMKTRKRRQVRSVGIHKQI